MALAKRSFEVGIMRKEVKNCFHFIFGILWKTVSLVTYIREEMFDIKSYFAKIKINELELKSTFILFGKRKMLFRLIVGIRYFITLNLS